MTAMRPGLNSMSCPTIKLSSITGGLQLSLVDDKGELLGSATDVHASSTMICNQPLAVAMIQTGPISWSITKPAGFTGIVNLTATVAWGSSTCVCIIPIDMDVAVAVTVSISMDGI